MEPLRLDEGGVEEEVEGRAPPGSAGPSGASGAAEEGVRHEPRPVDGRTHEEREEGEGGAAPEKRKAYRCGVCKGSGHTRPRCPVALKMAESAATAAVYYGGVRYAQQLQEQQGVHQPPSEQRSSDPPPAPSSSSSSSFSSPPSSYALPSSSSSSLPGADLAPPSQSRSGSKRGRGAGPQRRGAAGGSHWPCETDAMVGEGQKQRRMRRRCSVCLRFGRLNIRSSVMCTGCPDVYLCVARRWPDSDAEAGTGGGGGVGGGGGGGMASCFALWHTSYDRRLDPVWDGAPDTKRARE